MSHPYQCLYYSQKANSTEPGILVAASRSCVDTFSAQTGRYLSTWPSFESTEQTRSIEQTKKNEPELPLLKRPSQDDLKWPSKRQKVFPLKEESSSSSAEIVVAEDSKKGEVSSWQQSSSPPVIKLAGTASGKHVIAVTGEDKCIRVFDLEADGTLTQLSER